MKTLEIILILLILHLLLNKNINKKNNIIYNDSKKELFLSNNSLSDEECLDEYAKFKINENTENYIKININPSCKNRLEKIKKNYLNKLKSDDFIEYNKKIMIDMQPKMAVQSYNLLRRNALDSDFKCQ